MNLKSCELRRFALTLAAILCLFTGAARASDETQVRGIVQKIFQQLKARDYGAVYDSLPSSSRTRMSRERFTSALRRAQDMYVLDHIDIGLVKVSNDLAVVDTVLYGRLISPFQTEGKIIVQQYLVHEKGEWRVATGDNRTIRQFLAANPTFARKFPIRRPKIYVRQNGSWIQFSPPRRAGA
jgi:hypothetical protein